MSDQATTALIHNPPRAAAEIRHQLADLEDVKRAAQSLGASDFASKVGLASVLAHEKELQEELHAAELLESEADAELILRGLPPQLCRRADPGLAARLRSKPVSIT